MFGHISRHKGNLVDESEYVDHKGTTWQLLLSNELTMNTCIKQANITFIALSITSVQKTFTRRGSDQEDSIDIECLVLKYSMKWLL